MWIRIFAESEHDDCTEYDFLVTHGTQWSLFLNHGTSPEYFPCQFTGRRD